jgi:N-acetylglutamate synthase-like GNAT family acetyltransferase
VISIEEIKVRNHLQSGDLGYLIYLHGDMYSKEHGFDLNFEAYVTETVLEFYRNYDPEKDRVWICEHEGAIIGTLVLMHRGEQTAQLRYFLIRPEYRGIGLGKKLMAELMHSLEELGYTSAYLLTTGDLHAAASLYTRYGFTLTDDRETHTFGMKLQEQRYDLSL